MTSRARVAYYYDFDVGNYYYGPGHPMKPHRIRMAHNLILNYGLYKKMEVYRPHRATFEDMTKYHSDEYVSFLRDVAPDATEATQPDMTRFNVGEDCPVFDGLYEFCELSAGGSLAGAAKLNAGQADIAVNWSGGLHHAKKSEASGFCYINDIVLGILELLKRHERVLYVDIDIHHGDGVEEAFYCTSRVMTVSFHKFGEYFPGTGDIGDTGHGEGKNYAVNVPLKDGMNDQGYELVFKPIIDRVMAFYDPGAVVLQCGADSLAGDRLGCFNLSLKGHGKCVEYMKTFGKPLLLLGGGGYTIRNVARCWAYETSVALNTEIADELPFNDYYEYFGPDFRLHITPGNMENLNVKGDVDRIVASVISNLQTADAAPSIQSRALVDITRVEDEGDADAQDPDKRTTFQSDRTVEHPNEFYDPDERKARDIQNYKEAGPAEGGSSAAAKAQEPMDTGAEADEETAGADGKQEAAAGDRRSQEPQQAEQAASKPADTAMDASAETAAAAEGAQQAGDEEQQQQQQQQQQAAQESDAATEGAASSGQEPTAPVAEATATPAEPTSGAGTAGTGGAVGEPSPATQTQVQPPVPGQPTTAAAVAPATTSTPTNTPPPPSNMPVSQQQQQSDAPAAAAQQPAEGMDTTADP